MSELRRRITRLERQGSPEPELLIGWLRFLRELNRIHPLYPEPELPAIAREAAATGETPGQAWCRWMQQAWANETGIAPDEGIR
jgi:hypothetical protein